MSQGFYTRSSVLQHAHLAQYKIRQPILVLTALTIAILVMEQHRLASAAQLGSTFITVAAYPPAPTHTTETTIQKHAIGAFLPVRTVHHLRVASAVSAGTTTPILAVYHPVRVLTTQTTQLFSVCHAI